MLKEAPPSYFPAFTEVANLIGYPCRRYAKIIAIEGVPSSGKTSFASWLSWQLGITSIHLDLFIEGSEDGGVRWRIADLARAINGQIIQANVPTIVEGVFCLKALVSVGISPDWIILVENSNNYDSGSLGDRSRETYASDDFQAQVSARVVWHEPDE